LLRRAIVEQTIAAVALIVTVVIAAWWLLAMHRRHFVAARAANARALAEARAAAHSQRLAAMGRLCAGIAHEINNPLTALIASLDLASRRRRGSLEEAPTARLLGNASDAAARIRMLVQGLRRFAHPAGTREPVDVPAALETALQLTAARTLTVVREIDDVAPVLGSEPELVQVFVNLIVNAADAMNDTPSERAELAIRCHAGAGEIVVEISDRGPGFAPAARDHLFEPFATTKPVGQGTGLGLSICRQLVLSMGGRIEVGDRAGGGATVRVAIPTVAVARAADAVPGEPAHSTRSTPTAA
jgi:C4-dicarboxylate-specific signal transduction histidine kinase